MWCSIAISWRVLVFCAFMFLYLFLGWPKPQRLKASNLQVPRRVPRSANNPPAPRPTGERRRARSCLRNPAGGSCPGYASPAEASTFPTFFSSFFPPQIFLAKILHKAFPRDLPGSPKSQKKRLFAKKVVPRTLFLSILRSLHVFHTFSIDLWSVFHEKMKEKTSKSFTAAPDFLDLATLTIVRVLQYESHFSCFCFYHAFRKKKNASNFNPKRKHKKA